MKRFKGICKATDKVIILLLALIVLLIVVSTALQVISRYVFRNPYFWTEELAKVCGVWVTFLGAATVYRHKSHIAIDAIFIKLSQKWQNIATIFGHIAVMIFALTIIRVGIDFASRVPDRSTAVLGIPLRFIYSAAPVSAVLIALFTAETCLELFYDRRSSGE